MRELALAWRRETRAVARPGKREGAWQGTHGGFVALLVDEARPADKAPGPILFGGREQGELPAALQSPGLMAHGGRRSVPEIAQRIA
eukprot:2355081-Rhodomonas_salina.1